MTYEEWQKLDPVYFPRWAWLHAYHRNKAKYSLELPVYQGKKVILT